MTSLTRRVRGDVPDAGAYAIIYAAFMVAVLALAALVLDISSLREDRRTNRAATDSAATAGAEWLSELTGVRPDSACEAAWAYLVRGIESPETGDALVKPLNACDRFRAPAFTTAPRDYCAAPAPVMLKDERKVGRTVVVIGWPVPRGADEGFLRPDVAPAPVDAVEQEYNEDADGPDNGCGRIGVAVFEERPFGLASGLGSTGTTTQVHSVAVNIIDESNIAVAALNVLDRDGCRALQTSGGKVIVEASGIQPGIIAIESSGREQANGTCPNSRPYVLDPQENANNLVRADGPAPNGEGRGSILSYAGNPPPVGNPPGAHKPGIATSVLAPTPTLLRERYGATPVTDIYACTGTVDPLYPAALACDEPAHHINNLRAALAGTTAPAQYAGAPSPYYNAGTPVAFRALPDPTPMDEPTGIRNFKCVTQPSDPAFRIPAGNWWIQCPTLELNSLGTFDGGTLVFQGGIKVGSSTGCFVVNIQTSTCPTTTSSTIPPSTLPASNSADALIYMRGGTGALNTTANNLTKDGQGALFMPRTFVFQDRNAAVDLGAGSGAIVWSAPLADDCLTVPLCEHARFQKLMLWSDTTSAHTIGGQARLLLRGVLFTPRSQVNYNGQATTLQNRAQFWAWRISLSGSNTELRMAADPDNAIGRPLATVRLIR